MKKLFLLISLSCFTLYGQSIEGIVLDKISNKPIENVNVYIKSVALGTTTDKRGKFFINSKRPFNNIDTISFSYVGYLPKKYAITRLSGGLITVHLTMNSEQLEEVNIFAERKLKYGIDFKELTQIKKGVHSFGSVLVDGKIYIIAGDKSYIENRGMKGLEDGDLSFKRNYSYEKYDGNLKIYDIENDSWKYPEIEFRKRAYHNLNWLNGKIYIHGGKRLARNRSLEYLDDKIEVFDQTTNTIEIDDVNPHQAVNATSFVYDNKLIIIGGSMKVKTSGTKIYSNKSHIYNPDSGYWYEMNDMTEAKEAKGVLVNDAFYLFGGFKDNVLNTIDRLDLITGKWKKVGELFEQMERPGLASNNHMIYIFSDNVLATYNTLTNQLNQYYINISLKSPILYYYKNKLFVLGGYVPTNYSKLPSPKVFSIDLKELENTKIRKSKKFDF